MKKFILVIVLFFYSTASGQVWETIGSGVVDFLLSSPSSANKMNSDQQIALSIIGNLLNTAGDRKHDVNVADASQTQITLNTDSGQQIQLAMDTNGNVFALSNGIIYPIGNNVVNQAKAYLNIRSNLNSSELLPDYNLYNIKSNINIVMQEESPKICFSAKWYNDFNNNGMAEYSEYEDIRRNFFTDESFLISVNYHRKNRYSAKLVIFENTTGKEVYYDFHSKDAKRYTTNFPTYNDNFQSSVIFNLSNNFRQGIYTYHIKISELGKEFVRFTDKFQILAPQDYNINSSAVRSDENKVNSDDSLSELIQLLKEGKISEETFRVSMEALNKK